jgi:hypothetical protein
VVLVLTGVVGVAIAGAQPGDRSAPQATVPPVLNVAYVPRPSPWAVPRPTADPATFEGASALAATEFVIPPPRWLVSYRVPAATTRLNKLSWPTDPYED